MLGTNGNGFPWLNLRKAHDIPFVFNEGGRFVTFTVYLHPFALRLYLGADFHRWRATAPRRAWFWQAGGAWR